MGEPQLYMIHRNLEALPPVTLPDGYRVRHYRKGDGTAWTAIIAASFERAPERFRFDSVMRIDPAFCPERVFFIETRSGEAAATAAAWRRPKHWPDAGVIHYVGVMPGHRGKRLGYWVTLQAMHRIAREGWEYATLETDDFRLPAIKTYLRLGFEPLCEHETHPRRWREVLQTLGMPERIAQYPEISRAGGNSGS